MESLRSLGVIFVSTVLVNNYVLTKFLGMCPFLGVSGKMKSSVGMGLAVTFVMGIAGTVTWFLQYYILEPLNAAYLQTVVFILVIASLVQLTETAIRKLSPGLYTGLGVYLPLITTNCAVLGVSLNNVTDGFNFIESFISSLGCGIGFLLAMVLFSGMRERLDENAVPESFKGLPIILIAAAFLSMAFYGFSGVAENLFAP